MCRSHIHRVETFSSVQSLLDEPADNYPVEGDESDTSMSTIVTSNLTPKRAQDLDDNGVIPASLDSISAYNTTRRGRGRQPLSSSNRWDEGRSSSQCASSLPSKPHRSKSPPPSPSQTSNNRSRTLLSMLESSKNIRKKKSVSWNYPLELSACSKSEQSPMSIPSRPILPIMPPRRVHSLTA